MFSFKMDYSNNDLLAVLVSSTLIGIIYCFPLFIVIGLLYSIVHLFVPKIFKKYIGMLIGIFVSSIAIIVHFESNRWICGNSNFYEILQSNSGFFVGVMLGAIVAGFVAGKELKTVELIE